MRCNSDFKKKINIVRCQRELKRQKGRFPSEIALHLKKVCYKVSLCENCPRQSCKAFTGLSIPAKMVREVQSLLRKNLAETTHPLEKRRFSIDFRS